MKIHTPLGPATVVGKRKGIIVVNLEPGNPLYEYDTGPFYIRTKSIQWRHRIKVRLKSITSRAG